MKFYYIFLVVLFISISNTTSAQKNKKVDTETAEKRKLSNKKPKNAWQVGVFGGVSTLVGDVTPNLFSGNNPALPGHNFGLFVSKSWSYLISTRLRYSTSVMFTNDAVPSTLTQNQYDITKRNNDIGLNAYSPGQPFFHNSRTQGHDINFDLVFSLGNINYHRERSPVVFKIFPSIGMFFYQTFYDQLDENGNTYDYVNIANLNDLGVSNRTEVIKELTSMRDGVYETNAEEHVALDEEQLGGYNARLTYGLGLGIAVRVNKFLSIDIESRQSFVNDDLIDGMRWQEPGATGTESRNQTVGDDSYNQTTIGLTYSFVNKKVGESLSMKNPIWGSDIYDKKSKSQESTTEDIDSSIIKLKNQVKDLERQINNLDFLVKIMAKKQADYETIINQLENDTIKNPVENGIIDNSSDSIVNESQVVGVEVKIGNDKTIVEPENANTSTNNNQVDGLTEEQEGVKTNPDNKQVDGLTEEQQRLKNEAEILKNRESLNSLNDNEYKLRNGEYIYIADLKGEIFAKYYLVISSYRVKGNAKSDQKEWQNKGIKTYLMTDVKSGLYRNVLDYTDEHSKALDLLDQYQENLDATIWLIKAKLN